MNLTDITGADINIEGTSTMNNTTCNVYVHRDNDETPDRPTCILCGKKFTEFGNNPAPLATLDDGLACNGCNSNKVVPARERELAEREEFEATPLHWGPNDWVDGPCETVGDLYDFIDGAGYTNEQVLDALDKACRILRGGETVALDPDELDIIRHVMPLHRIDQSITLRWFNTVIRPLLGDQ